MLEGLRKRIDAVVPLNVPTASKVRLSRVLSVEERARLTLLMLDQVLSALRRAQTVSSITVVSADRNVARRVRNNGVRFLWERRRRGLNRAIRLAERKLADEAHSSILIIHADLPLITSRDVDAFIRTARCYQVGLVPSKDGIGTNALFLESPLLIRTAFGRRSFSKHLQLIRRNCLRYKIVRLRRISFDLDNADDLNRLILSSTRNDVGRFLRKRFQS